MHGETNSRFLATYSLTRNRKFYPRVTDKTISKWMLVTLVD